MQIEDRIVAIEQRAVALNLNLPRVCRRAGVDYSTVWRWRNGESRPLVETFTTITGALERVLDGLETEMRDRLNKVA